jgi:hypothetical protein
MMVMKKQDNRLKQEEIEYIRAQIKDFKENKSTYKDIFNLYENLVLHCNETWNDTSAIDLKMEIQKIIENKALWGSLSQEQKKILWEHERERQKAKA